MARINLKEFIEDENQKWLREQKVAVSKYFVGMVKNEKIIQINMYGTSNRGEPNPPYNHKTQVLQIDKETAKILIDLFNEYFDMNEGDL